MRTFTIKSSPSELTNCGAWRKEMMGKEQGNYGRHGNYGLLAVNLAETLTLTPLSNRNTRLPKRQRTRRKRCEILELLHFAGSGERISG
jgi:hypothetical protein